MTIKVDWEASPEKIRSATRIPDIFTPRDYGVVVFILAVVVTIGLLVH